MTDQIKLYYFISPYSHKDKYVMEKRYLETIRWAAFLTRKGYFLIEPIAMCHPTGKIFDLPTGYEYWKKRDRNLVFRSDGVIVLTLDGWKTSVGAQDEIKYAKSLKKEVNYFIPETEELLTSEQYYQSFVDKV